MLHVCSEPAVVFVFLLVPLSIQAKIGVGVGTGKIQVDEPLAPGGIYELPPITVLNTGDQGSTYKMSITYHEQQPELQPPLEWFTFTPAEFYLDPGQAQPVAITVAVPLKASPDKYFSYLEASPTIKSVDGSTSIAIAAASKLYFSVKPANMFQGIMYRIISLWKLYEPWTSRVAIFFGSIAVILIAKRFINLEVNIKKKS